MTLSIRIAIAALSIASIAPAFSPVQKTATVTATQNGQHVQIYAAESGHGTWLFPPNQNGGGNNG
jgi:hypothetical protein